MLYKYDDTAVLIWLSPLTLFLIQGLIQNPGKPMEIFPRWNSAECKPAHVYYAVPPARLSSPHTVPKYARILLSNHCPLNKDAATRQRRDREICSHPCTELVSLILGLSAFVVSLRISTAKETMELCGGHAQGSCSAPTPMAFSFTSVEITKAAADLKHETSQGWQFSLYLKSFVC